MNDNNIPIKFMFNEKDNTIHVNKTRYDELFNQFPEEIKNCMRFHNIYYEVESKVSQETFDGYKEFLVDSTNEPTINPENELEYYLLNQEFEIMTNYLSNKIDEIGVNLTILCYHTNSNSPYDKSKSEKYISTHLDDVIESQNYLEQFFKISIQSLLNIVNHPDRELTKFDEFYRIIIDKGNINSDYFILLPSLDASKFKSQENKRNANVERNNHFGFEPQNSSKYFLDIDQQFQKIKKESDHVYVFIWNIIMFNA